MKYVIYKTAKLARLRRYILTEAARDSGFFPEEVNYDEVILHPTEDKGALPIMCIPSVQIALGVYTESVNCEVLFSIQEIESAVLKLPEDWEHNE